MERMCWRELGLELKVVAREGSASRATGNLTVLQAEQQTLLADAVG
jgi:2-oxoglutarate dehydrogenase complex dehydrogenase (E1) component-like enzyme